MNIVCRYRKTTTMNSVYDLEKLISNCLVVKSETSSAHETEITVVTLKAHSDDQTVIIIGTKNGNKNADQEEKPTCLENMKHTNKEKSYYDPLQNQKEPTERTISDVENTLDEQPHDPSTESNKNLPIDQDKINDGQDFVPINVNIINLDESLQSSLIENVPKNPGITSTKVNKNKGIEEIATANKSLQNFDENDDQNWIMKKFLSYNLFH